MDPSLRFERAPRRVYWEVTRACDLACRHCRAVAVPHPHGACWRGRPQRVRKRKISTAAMAAVIVAPSNDRIGRGTLHIRAACVSVLGGIQPGPLERYLREVFGGHGNDGLLQRFQSSRSFGLIAPRSSRDPIQEHHRLSQ